ncbi:sensor histidine kinase [Mangrovimonas futianensis]|uniref:sensor histidine kinase n=1 Tax=Mangrovimonas futianensis TaxID=2895523 RepID=UPI001E349187|nr:sensor histidine kinase [Mangrovimonas futianensis]MCF1420790.1 sensor histidine kinase [Mangrovimonas futianensis]
MRFSYSIFLLSLLLVSYTSAAWSQNITSNATKRLIELDSLCDSQLKNDSLLKETIALAKQLKQYDIAVKQSANLIRFFNYETNTKHQGKSVITETKSLLPYVNDKELVGKYFFEVADLHYYLGEFEASLENYDSAFYYANNRSTSLQGLSKFGKGIVYVDKGEFGKASLALQEAITYFQADNDTLNWINAKNSMTILYGKNEFYNDETTERKELIDLALKYKNYPSLPSVYYNAAASANKMGNQKLRINYLKEALEVNKDSDYKEFFLPILKAGLVSAYADNDSLTKAEELLGDIEKNSNDISGFNESFYIDAKMRLAFMKKEYIEAKNYAERYLLLKKQSQEFEEIQQAERFLSRIYKKTGNSEKALEHFENYTALKDSILGVQRARILSYYQTLYETEKRDLKIQAQQSDIDLLAAKNKLKTQWLLFGGLSLVGLFAFISILRSRRFAKKEQKLQEELTQNIIASQEEERNRVAMELHDSVGQQLILLSRKAQNLNDETLKELTKQTLADVRSISHGLFPVVLKRLGFSAAVQDMVDNLDEESDVFFTTEIDPVDESLTEDKALHLYRIIQESLNNIVKHSEAKAVSVEIFKNEQEKVVLKIKDNGKGFDFNEKSQKSKSLGIKSIQERCKIICANLKITSVINEGTETKIVV